jgi:hypothetical protein
VWQPGKPPRKPGALLSETQNPVEKFEKKEQAFVQAFGGGSCKFEEK